jgi:hypothetical protein
MVVVVLPTPPFWLAMAMTRLIREQVFGVSGANARRLLVNALFDGRAVPQILELRKAPI